MTTISKSVLNELINTNDVEITDSDENLTVFCYTKCDEESSEIIKNCRGTIFNEDTLVMKTFPYTQEFNHLEKTKISEKFNCDDFSFYVSQEGSLIRMFFFNDKWYISTHKKLDAFTSSWSSNTSFGKYFSDALEREKQTNPFFQDFNPALDGLKKSLNPSNQYVFLLTNSEDNRIVCNSDPRVFHICTFINGVGGKCDFEDDIHLPHPEKISSFKDNTLNNIIDYVESIDITKYQGVIAFNKTDSFKHFKILNNEYRTLFAVRGNEPSVKFRYLQLRTEVDNTSVKLLKKLYPSYDFSETEDFIDGIAVLLYQAYIQRFIKKMYVILPKEEFGITKEVHNLYLTHKTPINLNSVRFVLNNSTAVQMNRMVKRFRNELKKDPIEIQSIIENYTYDVLFNVTFNSSSSN